MNVYSSFPFITNIEKRTNIRNKNTSDGYIQNTEDIISNKKVDYGFVLLSNLEDNVLWCTNGATLDNLCQKDIPDYDTMLEFYYY